MLSKLNKIVSGWVNYVFESDEVESIAKDRAKECAGCSHSVEGLIPGMIGDDIVDIQGMKCDLCNCPLSGLLRSLQSECKIGKWKAQA